MSLPSRLHLFQAFGVELEYMIVDRDTLNIRPIADELLKAEVGEYAGDFENGIVTWSNELVLHVIEMKSTRPESDFPALAAGFTANVTRINNILRQWNAMLLPTAAHPWMNPLLETKLWPHDNNDVYDAYNKIFDCRGHGWSNLQSTHLNLPFYDDEEFAKLHAAVRVVLPLLPALCASSPILDGAATGFLDSRLTFYKTNQQAIPSITGKVIPEAVFSKRQYHSTVYDRIKSDLAPFNENALLDPIWVNSRGAIPRFDRGSIEIRIMDIQECPAADLALQTLVIETIKALASERFASLEDLMHLQTDSLASVLDDTTRLGHLADVKYKNLLAVFGLSNAVNANELWRHIHGKLTAPEIAQWHQEINTVLTSGPLAHRMLQSLKGEFSHSALTGLYRRLAGCLAEDSMFRI